MTTRKRPGPVYGGLEDPLLRTDEGNAAAVEREAGGKNRPGQDFAVKLSLLSQVGRRGESKPLVEIEYTLIHVQPPPQGKRARSAMVKWYKSQRAGPLSAESAGWIRPPREGAGGQAEAYCRCVREVKMISVPHADAISLPGAWNGDCVSY